MYRLNFWITLSTIAILLAIFLETSFDRKMVWCTESTRPEGSYTIGQKKTIADTAAFEKDFVIVVKDDHGTQFWETFWKEHYQKWLTAWSPQNLLDPFAEKQTPHYSDEVIEMSKKVTADYKREIDSLSIEYQERGMEIWLINNTVAPIMIKTNLGTPVCIKEAKDVLGNWKTVETFVPKTGGCWGNFHYEEIFPGKALSVLTTNQNEGDFKTQMRYKIIGENQDFYSHTFQGTMNYCDFK